MEKHATPRHTLHKQVMTAIRYFAGRPLFFWLNAGLVGGWLYLLWSLFSSVFLSPKYFIYLAVLVLPAVAYAYLALIGDYRINFGLLVALFFVFAIGETYLRLAVAPPVETLSAPIAANGQHPYYMFTGIPNTLYQMSPKLGGA